MARTEREKIRCTVKEDGQGRPFLWFELLDGEPMPSFPRMHFGLGLNPGTTYAQARELADHFDQRVDNLFATISDP